jgi:hypothetical protein
MEHPNWLTRKIREFFGLRMADIKKIEEIP